MAAKAFARFDTDGNGVLDANEFQVRCLMVLCFLMFHCSSFNVCLANDVGYGCAIERQRIASRGKWIHVFVEFQKLIVFCTLHRLHRSIWTRTAPSISTNSLHGKLVVNNKNWYFACWNFRCFFKRWSEERKNPPRGESELKVILNIEMSKIIRDNNNHSISIRKFALRARRAWKSFVGAPQQGNEIEPRFDRTTLFLFWIWFDGLIWWFDLFF